MFALPGLLLLVASVYLRPHELSPALAALPFLPVALAVAVVGLAIDLKLRLSRPAAAPQLLLALLFHAWCAVGVGPGELVEVFTPFVVFVVIAHGVQSFRALELLAAALVVVAVAMAGVGLSDRGALADPEETALALGVTLPLLFALFARRRSVGWLVGLVLGTALIAAFVLLVRSPEHALERARCWAVGVHLWRDAPLAGVGWQRFDQYHYLTAHNAYLMVASELGLVGLWLWSSVLYVSAKIPWVALRRTASGPRPAVARAWSRALLVALAGLAAGMLFLSFAYHPVLWIFIGASGALYASLRRHDPDFEIAVTARELLVVLVFDVLLLVGLAAYV